MYIYIYMDIYIYGFIYIYMDLYIYGYTYTLYIHDYMDIFTFFVDIDG